MGTDNLFSGGRGRPLSRGNALASSVARHGVVRFRSLLGARPSWPPFDEERRAAQRRGYTPAPSDLIIRLGGGRPRPPYARPIAPRRGALQKRRRMRSSWRAKGSLFEAASPKNGSRPPVVWACSHRNPCGAATEEMSQQEGPGYTQAIPAPPRLRGRHAFIFGGRSQAPRLFLTGRPGSATMLFRKSVAPAAGSPRRSLEHSEITSHPRHRPGQQACGHPHPGQSNQTHRPAPSEERRAHG